MTMNTYPSLSAFVPGTFEIGLRSSMSVSTSPLNGSVQTVEIPGLRWMFSMTYGFDSIQERAQVAAYWAKVGGQANRVGLWHLARPAPRGTMRGAPVLASTAAVGATSASISTTAGATVKTGDMLTLGGRLIQIAADAAADGLGNLVVTFTPRLHIAAAAGSEVVWDRPKASFIITSGDVRLPYTAVHALEFSVELAEVGPYISEEAGGGDGLIFAWDESGLGWDVGSWAA